jgi:hypothetical protein
MITPEIVQTQPEWWDSGWNWWGRSIGECWILGVDPICCYIENPVLKDVTGTRKKKRRHEKRRYSDSYLEKFVEEFTETKGPEKPEEPIAHSGILKRAVFGIGSTSLGAGKSLLGC